MKISKMFLVFFRGLAFSVHEFEPLLGKSVSLISEQPPIFKNIENETYAFQNADRNFKAQISLVNTNITNTQRDSDYYSSYISITNTIFSNNFAFGAGIDPGNGGAIYAAYSILDIKSSGQLISNSDTTNTETKFDQCVAACGGAICSQRSAVYIQRSKFTRNRAYKSGGVIFFESDYNVNNEIGLLSALSLVIDDNNEFLYNCAMSGGAISASSSFEVYINSATFENNSADYAGGAIEFVKSSHLNIFDSKFYNNSVSLSTINKMYLNLPNYSKKALQNFTNVERFRGGGAIYSYSDSEPSFVNTYHCCIIDNFVNYDNSNKAPGHAILLVNSSWYSAEDCLKPDLDVSVTAIQQSTYIHTSGANCPTSFRINLSTLDPSSSPTSYNTTSSSTSSVPSPTTFTYQATPITRAPQATSSRIHTQTNFVFMNNSFPIDFTHLTVHSTPPATPKKSPDPSPAQTPSPSVPDMTAPIIKPTMTRFQNVGKTETISSTSTETTIVVLTNKTSSTLTYRNSSWVIIYFQTQVYTYSNTFIILEYIVEDTVKINSITAANLIYACTAGIGGFFLLAGMGLFLYRRSRGNYFSDTLSEPSSSSDETTNTSDPAGKTNVSLQIGDTDAIAEFSDRDDEEFMNAEDF